MQMRPNTSMAAVPGTDFSGLANLMAMKGRGGDNTLVHMSKAELPYLNMLAKSAGYPKGLPVNPETGLPEANILKTILPVAGAILGGMFLPGALPAFLGKGALATGIGAGLGSFGGSLLSGRSLKDAAIGGLISGGLAGVGSAVFGGGDALSANPATSEINPTVVNTQVGAANAATAIPPNIQAPELYNLARANLPASAPITLPQSSMTQELVDLLPATSTLPAPTTAVSNVLPEATSNLAQQFFPEASAISQQTAQQLSSLPAEAGFTDLGVLTNIPAGADKLAYLKYAAKPIATAGAAGVGVDALLGQGAFEPIDYSSFPQAGEERRVSPFDTSGIRFASRRTGAFPRTEEEALAFAQPGGTRQRFFNQGFFTPAKTGGGLARLVR